jgi:hypothetical protein
MLVTVELRKEVSLLNVKPFVEVVRLKVSLSTFKRYKEAVGKTDKLCGTSGSYKLLSAEIKG